MRRIIIAVVAISSVVLAACGDDDAGVSSSATTTVDHSDDEGEGEGRDPDARYGEDVCAALLQALEANTDGLDRYADDEVLAELSADPYHGRSDDLTITSDGETCTIGPFGDAEYVLTLEGDGHVGQRAVAIELVTGIDSGGSPNGGVGDAIAAYRADTGGCGEETGTDGDLVLEIDGGTIVALLCERFAYQNIYDLLRYDGEGLVLVSTEQWVDGGIEEGMGILGYPFVEDGLLANIEKARGLGDCGVYQQWYLDRDTLMLSAVYAEDCDDDDPVGPEDWPQVYPSGD